MLWSCILCFALCVCIAVLNINLIIPLEKLGLATIQECESTASMSPGAAIHRSDGKGNSLSAARQPRLSDIVLKIKEEDTESLKAIKSAITANLNRQCSPNIIKILNVHVADLKFKDLDPICNSTGKT